MLERCVVPPAARETLHACVAAVVGVPLAAAATTLVAAVIFAGTDALVASYDPPRTFTAKVRHWLAELAVPIGIPALVFAALVVVDHFEGNDLTRATLLCIASVLVIPVLGFSTDVLRR